MNINTSGKKIAIMGGSNCGNEDVVKRLLDKNIAKVKLLVCGVTRDVDRATITWAEETGTPYITFPAKKGDKGGVLRRNRSVIEYSDFIFVLWDGKSDGTKIQVEMIQQLKKPFKLVFLTETELKIVALEKEMEKPFSTDEHAYALAAELEALKNPKPTPTPEAAASSPASLPPDQETL